MLKKAGILVFIGVLCVGMVQMASAKTVIRVAHTIAPDSHYNQGLLYLDKLLKERTNGEIELEIYHSAQLGSERDAVEGVAMGTLEMTLISSAPLANFTNKFMLFDLPFIVRDREKLYAWLDGSEGQKILDSLLEQNLMGLGIWENGYRNLTNSKVAVKNPEDVKGLKIRLMENPIHVATFKTLGAYPVPMPFGELFTALQQGVVDGQENPMVIIYTSKFYEVQKYISLTGHFYAPAVLLINKAFWENTLTDEQRKIFKECEQEAKTWERQFSAKGEQDLAAKLKEAGMEVIEPDKEKWIEATKPIYQQFEEQIGKEMIESLVNAQN